jgi:hypothetical protein
VQRAASIVVAAGLLVLGAPVATGAIAQTTKKPPWTQNCTALNKRFPHGVGRAKARDRTSGEPVTSFRRSTRLYNIAMRWNRGLDRDKDGVACERA